MLDLFVQSRRNLAAAVRLMRKLLLTVKDGSDAIVAEVHRSRPAFGTAALRVPGEIEADYEAEYRRDGIWLANETVLGINEAAQALQVAVRLTDWSPHTLPT